MPFCVSPGLSCVYLVLCISLISIIYNNNNSPELVVEVRQQALHLFTLCFLSITLLNSPDETSICIGQNLDCA